MVLLFSDMCKKKAIFYKKIVKSCIMQFLFAHAAYFAQLDRMIQAL